jgi:hypothetical protein
MRKKYLVIRATTVLLPRTTTTPPEILANADGAIDAEIMAARQEILRAVRGAKAAADG